MKKYLVIIIIFFSIFFIYNNTNKKEIKKENIDKNKKIEEKQAIFISYIELQKYIGNKDSKTSMDNIDKIINNLDDSNFNMIILQVRSFADAIYKSKYYPYSKGILNNKGSIPDYDILKYFIEKSHNKNIEVHAWINPYRIRNDNDTEKLDKDSIIYKWLNTNNVNISDKGIFFNPASSEVQKLITDGIEELIDNYKIDGIHFDDYFYSSDSIDIENYNEYIKSNNISKEDYHLQMVNDLVKEVYKVTKKNKILFGISPEGNINNNYTKNYADVKRWAASNEYVDYLMPQIYYGFNNEAQPFYDVINTWNNLTKKSNVRIMPALALYKSGEKDKYAKSGEDEWIENDNILMRQILISRNITSYEGFAIFRYDSMFSEDITSKTVLNEIKNIKSITKEKNL